MADADLLRAEFSGIAADDALVVFYVPREGKDRPHRHLRFWQVDKAAIWHGVGQGADMPPYVMPPDDPAPPEPPPAPPPAETVAMVVQSIDGLNVRATPGKAGLWIRLVKRGVILVVEKPTVTADGYLWHKLANAPGYVAEGKADKSAVYLLPKV